MEHFDDFTYYAQLHYENALNIGFSAKSGSDQENSFAPNRDFQQKLAKYAKHRVNLVRGGADFQMITVDGEAYALGFGEIRVIAADGTVYAAPDLIIDWVANGSYIPPKAFEDAVLHGLDPDGDAYGQFESRYKPDLFWGASDDCLMTARLVSSYMEKKDLAGFKQFLEANPQNLNIVTQNGTLLNGALLSENEEMAEYLLEKGVSLSMLSGIELLTAVEKGMTSIVQRMLSANIPIRTDIPRNNPLFWAIAKKQNEIAKLLYDERKDLVMTYDIGAIQNCNILQWSKLCDNTDFFNSLMNIGYLLQ